MLSVRQHEWRAMIVLSGLETSQDRGLTAARRYARERTRRPRREQNRAVRRARRRPVRSARRQGWRPPAVDVKALQFVVGKEANGLAIRRPEGKRRAFGARKRAARRRAQRPQPQRRRVRSGRRREELLAIRRQRELREVRGHRCREGHIEPDFRQHRRLAQRHGDGCRRGSGDEGHRGPRETLDAPAGARRAAHHGEKPPRPSPRPRARCARRRCPSSAAWDLFAGTGSAPGGSCGGVRPEARSNRAIARAIATIVSETVVARKGRPTGRSSRRARSRTPRRRRACRPAGRAPARDSCTRPSRRSGCLDVARERDGWRCARSPPPRASPEAFARPKSSTLTVPSAVNLTLAGFRSRWTMPLPCAASSASAICRRSRSASSSGRPRRAPALGELVGQRRPLDELHDQRRRAAASSRP